MPSGALAAAAATYAAKLGLGLPTYLDTLPRLRTVVSRNGEMLSQLLKDDDHYVPGGTVWKRQPNFQACRSRPIPTN